LEKAWRRSEERFQTVIENLTEGLVIARLDGHLLHWNPAALAMHGFKSVEQWRLGVSEFFRIFELSTLDGAVLPLDQWPISRVIRGERLRDFPVRIRRLDLDWERVFNYAGSIVREPSGEQLVFLAISDITERRRTEQIQLDNLRLEEENRRFAEASRLKNEFLANISHELRTPLNGIIGFTELLADEKPGPVNRKQQEYLGTVLTSARHLLQLINDVLDLAKVEAGKFEFKAESFRLRESIDEVCAVLRGMANKKKVLLRSETAPELGFVTLDEHRFKQVCYNLLSNAVKFTDTGGSVDIIAVERDAATFEVRVTDTGIGIRRESMDRLFRQFEQLESGASRRFEGTGLGLALSKKRGAERVWEGEYVYRGITERGESGLNSLPARPLLPCLDGRKVGGIGVFGKEVSVLINTNPNAGERIGGGRLRSIGEITKTTHGTNQGRLGQQHRFGVERGLPERINLRDCVSTGFSFLSRRPLYAKLLMLIEDNVFNFEVCEVFETLIFHGDRVSPLLAFRGAHLGGLRARGRMVFDLLFLDGNIEVRISGPGNLIQ
jgi:signal transduction histidine kinase